MVISCFSMSVFYYSRFFFRCQRWESFLLSTRQKIELIVCLSIFRDKKMYFSQCNTQSTFSPFFFERCLGISFQIGVHMEDHIFFSKVSAKNSLRKIKFIILSFFPHLMHKLLPLRHHGWSKTIFFLKHDTVYFFKETKKF